MSTCTSKQTANTQLVELKYLNFMAMFYMSTALLSSIFVFKIVSLGATVITAGALLSPLWYFIADIITEVYGYNYTKRIIWFELILELFFVSVGYLLYSLPSPDYWQFNNSYSNIIGNLPRVFLGSLVGTILGSFLNTALISKWKILLSGKSFWLRSLGANAIGQLVLSVASTLIDLTGIIPLSEIVKAIFTAYPIKLLSFSIFIIPTAIAAEMLKNIEGIDTYDRNVNYNPFSLN